MKISYQQLCFILLCASQQLPAVTLFNNSDWPIKYNIFNKRWLKLYSFCKPFPKHRGTIQAQQSKIINDLDPQTKYVVTFYDVHNAQHNQRYTIQGDAPDLAFDIKNKTYKELPAFVDLQ
jgi:hypothetical protein